MLIGPARRKLAVLLAGVAVAAAASAPAARAQTQPPDTVPDSARDATRNGIRDSARHSASPAPVYLRLSPEPNLTLTYAHRVRARVDAPAQLGGDQSLTSTTRLRQTAVRVGPDSLDLRIEVEAISLSADSVPEEQLPDLERHEGRTFLARMTTRGELVRMTEGAGDGGGGGRNVPGGRAGGISPVQRSVRMSTFPTLPEEPVRPGDSWSDTTRVRTGVMQGMGEGTTTAVSRTTLDSIRQEGETRVAELSVVTSYTFEPADSAGGGLSAHMSGSGSASVRFDLTNGRYLRSESAQDYTVNLQYPGSSEVYSVRFHVDTGAQLVGVGTESGESDSGVPADGPAGAAGAPATGSSRPPAPRAGGAAAPAGSCARRRPAGPAS